MSKGLAVTSRPKPSQTVKRAICEAHREAASNSDTGVPPDLCITAHQVRHVSTSLAQLGPLPLAEIIKAGGWSTPSTYLRHYLQFLPPALVDELQQVGAFVSAGAVGQPRPAPF